MILADENISSRCIHMLRERGIDVLSVFEDYRGVSDEQVIQLSKEFKRIILTQDKDFGEWVFAHKAEGLSVILLRYSCSEEAAISRRLCELIGLKESWLFNKFTTISLGKVKYREI